MVIQFKVMALATRDLATFCTPCTGVQGKAHVDCTLGLAQNSTMKAP